MTPPRKFSALPPRISTEASPKAISRRTSYRRVRLECLPYPHLIPTLFNGCGFGPPLPFTAASTWTWIDHPVSGLPSLTLALLSLGFPTAPVLKTLTLPVSATRRTVLQKVRGRAYKALPQLVNTGFQVLFSYGSFNLDMDRSPGFGSPLTDSGPIKTWFPYGSGP